MPNRRPLRYPKIFENSLTETLLVGPSILGALLSAIICKTFWKTVIGKSWAHKWILLWGWRSPQRPGVDVHVSPRPQSPRATLGGFESRQVGLIRLNCELFAGRSGYRKPVGDSRYTRDDPPA